VQQVLQTDSAWADAENRHDISALDRILDDQCTITSASGKTETKQEFLKQFTGEVKAVVTQDLVDRKVHIDGDTAILTETDNYTYTDTGHTSTGSLRLTTTYLHRGDRWVAIAEQMNAPRSKPDLSAAEATLCKLDAEWAQTKHVDAWLSFYSDDAIVLPPNDKIANGKEAARKSVAALLGLPNLQLTWKAARVEVAASGDFAYIAGVYTMTFSNAAGKRVPDSGKTLEVWKLQPDGKWKCVADTWNSDLPNPAQ
jgi:ketosteroid isomerase-like protein